MSLDQVRATPAPRVGPPDTNGEDAGDATPTRPRRRRRALVGVAVLAVPAAVAAAVVVLTRGDGGSGSAGTTAATTTVPVEVRDLVTSEELAGELGFGEADSVTSGRDGVVTGTSATGTTVGQGGVLFHLDLQPTVLLPGAIPAFRDLSVDTPAGADILQLEQALVGLGYGSGVTVDGSFTAATATAVTAWETALGRTSPDGVVTLGDVLFAPTDLRIAAVTAEAGTQVQSGAEVVQATPTTKVVTLGLSEGEVANVDAGTPVAITLPDNTETTGTVTGIATEPSSTGNGSNGSSGSGGSGSEGEGDDGGDGGSSDGGSGESEDTYPVTVSLDDPALADVFDSGSVTVVVERSRVEDATAVPVIALLARSEGGYALQVADDSQPEGYRFVPVEIGAIADEWVQVTGDGIEAGVEVVVPE